jgi:hypothetical protein
MNTFANAVVNQSARTENDMKARASTASACVDLFYKIGASRGKNIVPSFIAAYEENSDVALRIVQWARDIRGGCGERQLYRDVMRWMELNEFNELVPLIHKTPEIGRWDDLLTLNTSFGKLNAFNLIKKALNSGNGLCAKWLPREKSSKNSIATELRKFLGLSPKEYRKLLVNLTKVVETQMCANDWDNINFSHVPSLAHSRYKKAFYIRTAKYVEYVSKLISGDSSVKVNANAVYPYDVLKGLLHLKSKTEQDLIIKQWEALENFIGDANILPMIDVSGSMTIGVSKNSSLSCLEVAVSLGLYMTDKNNGSFKNLFLTFSESPQLLRLNGNIIQKMQQMIKSKWGMNTNLIIAVQKILRTAIEGNVPQEEMPKALVILSDMQFDRCATFDDSAMEMIKRKYIEAGYVVPLIVFWNLNAYDNVPVKFDEHGVVLISGFSPAIMKAVLNANIDELTPETMMLKTVMIDRYKLG